MMKRTFPVFLLALLPLLAEAGEAVVPEKYDPIRYESIWKKSPFTLSSVETEYVGGFAEDLVLAGILKIGNRDYVSIINKKTKERLLLTSEAPVAGISLAKLEPSQDLSGVRVILKKGMESAVLRYDQEVMKAPLTGAPAASVVPPAIPASPALLSQPPPAAKHLPATVIPNRPPTP